MIISRQRKEYIFFLTCDFFCMVLSYITAVFLRYGWNGDMLNISLYGPALLIILFAYSYLAIGSRVYAGIYERGFFAECLNLFEVNFMMALLLSLMNFIMKPGNVYSRLFFGYFFIGNLIFMAIGRKILKHFLYKRVESSITSSKLMVITTSDRVNKILMDLRRQHEWGVQLTSLTILDKDMVGQVIDGIRVVANKDNLFEIATLHVVDEVFIYLPYELNSQISPMIKEFTNMGIVVNLNVNTYDMDVDKIEIMGDFGVISYSSRSFNPRIVTIKRCIDIIGATVGLLLTGIVAIFIAPMILIESPGPIVFSQERIGKNGRRFKFYKFRSMYLDAEERKAALIGDNEMSGLMFKIKDDPRITRVGNFIRKTSIDEFPQFWNVLKGDMSLVGTRPPTMDEFERYESRHKRRLSFRPGITGLWQVSGRSDITDFEEVVKLDLEYIDNWSLVLDIKILIKTIFIVFHKTGSK